MKTILFLRSAEREVEKLTKAVQDQVNAKLARYAETGAGDMKALAGEAGLRLRSGDYRIIFSENENVVLVRAVRHRRDVYRKRN